MLSRALAVLENHVASQKVDDMDSEGSRQRINEALRDVLVQAMQPTGGEQQAYAVQLLLSLSQRSDIGCKTHFATLSGLGVSLDRQYGHIDAMHDLEKLVHDCVSLNENFGAQGVHLNSNRPFRLHVREPTWWPRICTLLMSLSASNPFLRIDLSTNELLSGTESFVEFVTSWSNGLKCVNVLVGATIMADSAFLASLWSAAKFKLAAHSHMEAAVSLHLLAPMLRCIFSRSPFPSSAVLPRSLLVNSCSSPESLSQFLHSAEQLILESNAQKSLHQGTRDPTAFVPSHSAYHDIDFGAPKRVVWLSEIEQQIDLQAKISLQAHLNSCGWQTQQLAAQHMVSFFESSQITGPSNAKKQRNSEKPCVQAGGDRFLVLHFAWTGRLPSNDQRESATVFARSLASAMRDSTASGNNAVQVVVVQYWEEQQKNFSEDSAELTCRLFVALSLCLAIIEVVLTQPDDCGIEKDPLEVAYPEKGDIDRTRPQMLILRFLVDALLEVCRSGIALAPTDAASRWSIPAAATGVVGVVLLINHAEAFRGTRNIQGQGLERLFKLLALSCNEEGAPLCDLLRTLPQHEAEILRYRLD